MYSAEVLEHFKNPRNAGDLPGASAVVEASNPVCGDVLQLAVRLEAGRVAEVRFKATGCTTAIACGSALTEMMQGRSAAELGGISAEAVAATLGGLPPATTHASQLAADALALLVKKLS
jgi:nitrogen fixation NifU-like protein